MSNCPVCFEILNTPTLCLPCGHTFCNTCISTWMGTSPNSVCPQCRVQIQRLQRIYLDTADDSVMSQSETSPTISTHKHVGLVQWFCQQYRFICFYIDRLKEITRWRYIRPTHKYWIFVGAILLVSIIVIKDARSSTGFLQGLILPILNIVVYPFKMLISSISFTFLLKALYQIVYCLFYAVYYVVWTTSCTIFGLFAQMWYYSGGTLMALLRLGLILASYGFIGLCTILIFKYIIDRLTVR